MSTFRFRQFSVDDSLCGMKVGTDGVLLGAWSPLPSPSDDGAVLQVLDAGTGSGLIALMLAQRQPSAHITALDIDPLCVTQAEGNFSRSPWSDRLSAICTPLQDYTPPCLFSLIVSNPPYFRRSLLNPDASRALARHDDTLPLSDIFSFAEQHLTPDGILSLVLPSDLQEYALLQAHSHSLRLSHLTRVCTRAGKEPKRILAAFTPAVPGQTLPAQPTAHVSSDTLCLIDDDRPRSRAYSALTQDFYL